jgi:hypothetical protein
MPSSTSTHYVLRRTGRCRECAYAHHLDEFRQSWMSPTRPSVVATFVRRASLECADTQSLFSATCRVMVMAASWAAFAAPAASSRRLYATPRAETSFCVDCESTVRRRRLTSAVSSTRLPAASKSSLTLSTNLIALPRHHPCSRCFTVMLFS